MTSSVTFPHRMRRLRHLTSRHRSASTNEALGLLLAFNAGAVNAGGFLVLRMYTSHMTGFASQLADSLVLGNATLMLNAVGALAAFMSGAAVCAILVNRGRQRRLHSVYAVPLMLEALLLLAFGSMGAMTLTWPTPFAVPLTVLLLSFIMGLQNAVVSKTSAGSIRTTHMTGNITDLGMELGKLLYWNRAQPGALAPVRHDRRRMRMAGGLVAAFLLGGLSGALGFKVVGFVCVVPLAALLLALAVPPFVRDLPRTHALRRWQAGDRPAYSGGARRVAPALLCVKAHRGVALDTGGVFRSPAMLSLNVGNIDRALRLVVGVTLLLLAISGKIGPWGYVGVVPLVTGAFAWCPLYRLLGIRTTAR